MNGPLAGRFTLRFYGEDMIFRRIKTDQIVHEQFRFDLRRVFVAVSLLCVMYAVTASVVRLSVILYVGFFFCIANFLGVFSVFQNGMRIRWVCVVAVVMYIVSLFLPAFEIHGTIKFPGFQLAVNSMDELWETAVSLDSNLLAVQITDMLFLLCITLGIVAMMLLAASLFGNRLRPKAISAWLLVPACVAAWIIPIAIENTVLEKFNIGAESLRIGYYVWCAALLVATIAVRIGTAQLVLLVSVSVALIAKCIYLGFAVI